MSQYDVSTQTKPNQVSPLNGRVGSKLEPVTSAVHSTRNYSQFRFSGANRPVNPRHLERMHDAIERKNLLEHYPILVTPQMVVIDGQHRLKVAEALRVPIYYKITENMAVEDISNINDVVLRWNLSDYLHYWCDMGNEEYRKVDALAKKWSGVSLTYLIQTLSYQGEENHALQWMDIFRSGKMTASGLERAETVLSMAHDFKPYLGKRWASRAFLATVNALTEDPEYNHRTMMRRITYQSTRLVPCITVPEYLALLSAIYNYRTQEGSRVDFSKSRNLRRARKGQASRKRASA